MIEAAQRFPLSWPTGWKRTPGYQRQRANFSKSATWQVEVAPGQYREDRSSRVLSVADAIARLSGELSRLGATNEILSTNVATRLDGLPRSGQSEPNDPGAACYFRLKGKPRVLACDKWNRVADNIAAIAQHIDALRRIDRYGVGTMEQAFAGYAALPPDPGHDWRLVFGFKADELVSPNGVNARYRAKLQEAHPDSGGSHELMVRLNQARDAAMRELGEEAVAR